MANAEPNGNKPAKQPNLDAIDLEISKLCRKLEATQVLNPPKRRQNDWKRVAEQRYLSMIEQHAADGDELAQAVLEVHKALASLAVAMQWPEVTVGQMAQFIFLTFEETWRDGAWKRVNRRR